MGVYLYTLASPKDCHPARHASTGEEVLLGQMEFGYKILEDRIGSVEERRQTRHHNKLLDKVAKAWPDGVQGLAGVVYKGALADLLSERVSSIEVMQVPTGFCQSDASAPLLGRLYRAASGALEYEPLT